MGLPRALTSRAKSSASKNGQSKPGSYRKEPMGTQHIIDPLIVLYNRTF